MASRTKDQKKSGQKPEPKSIEVVLVSKSGTIIHDGALAAIENGKKPTILFRDGRKESLCPGQLVVEKLDSAALANLPANTPVLLVEMWGCGGVYMERGYFTQRLEGSFICFASGQGQEAQPLDLKRFGNGSYKVLWGM